VPARTVIYFIAGVVVGVLLLYSAIRGDAPDSASEWLAPIGPAVTAAVIGLLAWDRWIWRWPIICKLHGRPVLHGTWRGELASEYESPETGERVPADPDVCLVVRQRFWDISVRLLTKESSSSSMFASFKADDDGVHQLVYVYENTPRAEVRQRSPVHYGAVVLNAPRDRKAGLTGHYFTDRYTIGEMRFNRHFKKLVDTHAEGHELAAS
jgi:hypothetical protein